MSRINKGIIGELQTKTIQRKAEEQIQGLDLCWRGYDKTEPEESFIKEGTQAHINRVLFWFASRPDDYVRSSLKGGLLYDLIGKLCSTTNLEDWKDIIQSRFNEEFSNDLSIIYINLEVDKQYKVLTIELLVRDVLENKIFTVKTKVQK